MDDKMNDIIFIIAVIFICIIAIIFIQSFRKNNNPIKNITRDKTQNTLINKVSNKTATHKTNNEINVNTSFLQLFKDKCKSKTADNTIALKVYRNNNWINITYKQYYKNCIKFAASFNKNCENSIIGIIGTNSPILYYTYLGAMLSGGIPIILSNIIKKYNIETLEHIINNSNIKIILVEDIEIINILNKIKNNPIELIITYQPITNISSNIPIISYIDFTNNVSQKEINTFKPNLNKFDEIATLIYPFEYINKQENNIPITYNNILHNISNIYKTNILNLDHENIMSCLNLNNTTHQIFEIFLPILSDSCVWFPDKNCLFTSNNFIKNFKKINPSVLHCDENIYNLVHNDINKHSIFDIFFNSNKYLTCIKTTILLNIPNTYLLTPNTIHLYGLNNTGIFAYDLTDATTTNTTNTNILNIGKLMDNYKIKLNAENIISIKNGYDKNYMTTNIKGSINTQQEINIINDNENILYFNNNKYDLELLEISLKTDLLCIINDLQYVLIHKSDNVLYCVICYTKELSKDIQKNINKLIKNYNISKYLIYNTEFVIGKEITTDNKLRRKYILNRMEFE